jgi:hypothetical protein
VDFWPELYGDVNKVSHDSTVKSREQIVN